MYSPHEAFIKTELLLEQEAAQQFVIILWPSQNQFLEQKRWKS